MKRGLLYLLMLLPLSGWAQDTLFTADIQLLSRGEIRNGGMTSDQDDPSSEDKSAFILDRERLILGYKRDWLEAKTTIQHVGTWGHEGAASVNVYEAWAKANANNGLFAQIGRLALRYDDERIIGSDDWVMVPMTHDALRFGYEGHGHRAHAILAYNQNMRAITSPGSYYTNGSRPYKTMHTVWYHYDVPKVPLGVSLLFMNIGMQSGVAGGVGDNRPQTEWQLLYGGYLKFAPSHFTLEGSYYRQAGHDEYRAKLDAWMAAVKAEWQPNDSWSAVAGFDYLSGDDYVPVVYGGMIGLPYHETEGGFTPLYGSRTQFYGIMDYFYESAYTQGFTPGLQNAYLGVLGNPIPQLSCSANYHYMAVATDLKDFNRTLGHSIELEAKYRFSPYISLTAGYTYMIGTETMECLKQQNCSKHARWGWFSLVISPSILTTKW